MVSAREYNDRVRAAARNQPLRGVTRPGIGIGNHDWKITVARGDDLSTINSQLSDTWRVYVGPGAVNDRIASITYLRTGDPRGWTMPDDYPAIPEMKRIYGKDFQLVDRKLTDKIDPPYLVVTSPAPSSSSSSSSSSSLGDFERVPDRSRPPFFRTEPMWELDLYQARVFIVANQAKFMRIEDLLHFPFPATFNRFRVAAARALPDKLLGSDTGGFFELGRLYLLRDPEGQTQDQLLAQQTCFWSLWTINSNPNPYGGFNLLPGSAPNTGLIANSVGAGLGAAFSDFINQIIAGIYESAASVEFWTAP